MSKTNKSLEKENLKSEISSSLSQKTYTKSNASVSAGTVNLNSTIIQYPAANLAALQAYDMSLASEGVIGVAYDTSLIYMWNGSDWVATGDSLPSGYIVQDNLFQVPGSIVAESSFGGVANQDAVLQSFGAGLPKLARDDGAGVKFNLGLLVLNNDPTLTIQNASGTILVSGQPVDVSSLTVGSGAGQMTFDTSSLTALRTITVGDYNNLVIPNGFLAPTSSFVMTELGTDGNSTGTSLVTDLSMTINTSYGAGQWQFSVNLPYLSSSKGTAFISGFSPTITSGGNLDIITGATTSYSNGLSTLGTTGINLTTARQFQVTASLHVDAASGAAAFAISTASATIATQPPVAVSSSDAVIQISGIITTTTGSPSVSILASSVSGTVNILSDSTIMITEI